VSDPFVGLGYGALSNFNFLIGNKENTRTSNAQAYLIKTTNGQLGIQVNHQVFTSEEKNIYQGKIQYLDWPESVYQLGANTLNDKETKEIIGYKAIDLDERVLHQIKKNQFIGLQYKLFYCWQIKSDKDTLSFFENNAIGTNSFTASGVGVHYVFDSRDNVQNAYSGKYIEVATNPYVKFLGSTQNWFNLRLDARSFYQFKKAKQPFIWANRFLAEQAIGDVPYLLMPQTGRYFSTRAYAQGRYRGKTFLAYESELRYHLWRFIGGVTFAGVNTVSEPDDNIKYMNPNICTGLRFNINKLQRTNIRVDYAIGANNNSGLYFHITEVF
jgi:hypothetical protein